LNTEMARSAAVDHAADGSSPRTRRVLAASRPQPQGGAGDRSGAVRSSTGSGFRSFLGL